LPAPAPSARARLSRALFGDPHTLGDVERPLLARLQDAGYEDVDYFRVPGGFAMASRAERIYDSGAPYTEPQRWQIASAGLCAWSTLPGCLFHADPGRYRILVFLVTTATVITGTQPVPIDTMTSLTTGGADRLPASVASQPLTPDHDIAVLVYEYRRSSVGSEGAQQVTGVSATTHLRKAGILR
jgi:hypothetical protein